MRRSLSIVLASAALVAGGGTANAQGWGIYIGNGGGYGGRYHGYDDDDDGGYISFICSGRRAHRLEGRLRHEVREGEIDGWAADRIHNAIDRVEDRQRHECAEGDWGAIRGISHRYDYIARWIDSAAHRRWRPGWRGGW